MHRCELRHCYIVAEDKGKVNKILEIFPSWYNKNSSVVNFIECLQLDK